MQASGDPCNPWSIACGAGAAALELCPRRSWRGILQSVAVCCAMRLGRLSYKAESVVLVLLLPVC